MTEHDLGRWQVDDTHLVLRGIESTHEFRGLLQSMTHRSLTIFAPGGTTDVRITFELSSGEPHVHPGDWDDVVETSVRPTGPDDVVLVSIDRTRPRGARLLSAGSGAYRLRVHRGRRVEDGRDDQHVHLALWPAHPGPARVLAGHARATAALPRAGTQRHGRASASASDQRLVDEMTRRLIDRARPRRGGRAGPDVDPSEGATPQNGSSR